MNEIAFSYKNKDEKPLAWHTFNWFWGSLLQKITFSWFDDIDNFCFLKLSFSCMQQWKNSTNRSLANMFCFSWLKCTMGVLSFTNNAVFCRSRPRKPWQQTFSEVFGTRWKILWFIPFRQRQPLRVPYHFANHV